MAHNHPLLVWDLETSRQLITKYQLRLPTTLCSNCPITITITKMATNYKYKLPLHIIGIYL